MANIKAIHYLPTLFSSNTNMVFQKSDADDDDDDVGHGNIVCHKYAYVVICETLQNCLSIYLAYV